MLDKDKHSWSFCLFAIGKEKKFQNVDTRCQCYKTFVLHHWCRGLIS